MATGAIGTVTNLPVPRFGSLKVGQANLRRGPGTEYPTAWVYNRAGWPLEIVREFDVWRQVRDADGTTGWIQASLLSGRRQALVTPWETDAALQASQTAVRAAGQPDAAVTAWAEPGVMVAVMGCDGQWCRVSTSGVRGFVEQVRLWGVYPGEIVK